MNSQKRNQNGSVGENRSMRLKDNENANASVWTRPQSFYFSHTLLFLLFLFLSNATFFLTKNDKKSTRGIQSIFWRQMEWVSLASLFIPPCGEFPFQPRKTVILKTVIFSGQTLQLENGKAETSGNFSCMDPTTKIQRRWQI